MTPAFVNIYGHAQWILRLLNDNGMRMALGKPTWTGLLAGTHGPAHLDARIDTFLAGFAPVLARMSPDELDDNRSALIAAKTLKDATLPDEADRNWEQIQSRRWGLPSRPAKSGIAAPCVHACMLLIC